MIKPLKTIKPLFMDRKLPHIGFVDRILGRYGFRSRNFLRLISLIFREDYYPEAGENPPLYKFVLNFKLQLPSVAGKAPKLLTFTNFNPHQFRKILNNQVLPHYMHRRRLVNNTIIQNLNHRSQLGNLIRNGVIPQEVGIWFKETERIIKQQESSRRKEEHYFSRRDKKRVLEKVVHKLAGEYQAAFAYWQSKRFLQKNILRKLAGRSMMNAYSLRQLLLSSVPFPVSYLQKASTFSKATGAKAFENATQPKVVSDTYLGSRVDHTAEINRYLAYGINWNSRSSRSYERYFEPPAVPVKGIVRSIVQRIFGRVFGYSAKTRVDWNSDRMNIHIPGSDGHAAYAFTSSVSSVLKNVLTTNVLISLINKNQRGLTGTIIPYISGSKPNTTGLAPGNTKDSASGEAAVRLSPFSGMYFRNPLITPQVTARNTAVPVKQVETEVKIQKSALANYRAPTVDINRIVDRVYNEIERKIKVERQRRGH